MRGYASGGAIVWGGGIWRGILVGEYLGEHLEEGIWGVGVFKKKVFGVMFGGGIWGGRIWGGETWKGFWKSVLGGVFRGRYFGRVDV